MADTPKHHRQRDLLAYVQDFLDPEERRELEEHMKDCPDCQKTLEEVRRFLPALQKALTPEEVSTAEMWSRVQAEMRNRPPVKEKEPFFTRMRLALAVSGAALATTVLIVLQPLVQQGEVGAVAKRQQQPASGIVAAPHRPGYVAAPHRPGYEEDAGPDGGLPEEDAGE
jgi:anti-sigma factor RsiW